ncbi:hypothetical protein Hhal_1148 [Halorhodospira halophila SL1]|uniref:Transposase IS204/IS1001/IS1096/IS1165 zinc-finger domain-containing protein n=1 Tax=Halorhodospira halophila (strain DSM 244 / SL1) TaxID=349124 RepID=A1WW62_HALHL|nr:transposase family protein [Halorhodospira halophila]ABM61924.1 hypothetical protein Hhal_1148 [Halorhodospira halophila SL1]
MATEYALFTAALGLSAPREVSDIRFDVEAKRIDFDVTFASGSRFACPACGAEGQPVHGTRQRTWQHLHFFEHQAYIHAAVPRVRCQDCGKTSQVEVPWARPESGFTQLFEALCQRLRLAPVQWLRRGDERPDPGGQGARPRLSHHAQPDHRVLSHRRQAHPSAGVTLRHNM